MTRKNLIDAIYHNADKWSCPKKKCNDYNGKKCRKCAEELLAKYERKFYNKGYRDGEKNVAEKIKADIEQLPTTICWDTFVVHLYANEFKESVLAILDKYMTKEGSSKKNEDKQVR